MIVYHVTGTPFEQVDLDIARKIIKAPGSNRNPKGALGLWTSTIPRQCSGFGAHCAKIAIKSDFSPIAISLSRLKHCYDNAFAEPDELSLSPPSDADLARMLDNSVDLFSEFGRKLGGYGDVLFIKDGNRTAGEIIILNPGCIEAIEWQRLGSMTDVEPVQYPMRDIYFDPVTQQKVDSIAISEGCVIELPAE